MVRVSVPMHLSRVVLEPGRGEVDLYALHQRLWRAFDAPAGARPFLFRADVLHPESDQLPLLKILVQSEVVPQWDRVEPVSAETRPWPFELAEGDALRFFLRANPTRARKDRKEFGELDPAQFRARRGRRVPLWNPEERERWLVRKALQAGFSLTGVRTSNARPWRWRHGSTRALHDGVDFEGTLRVVDPARLADALRAGIGAGKAFGFGLLSLAPHRAVAGPTP